MKGRSHKYDIHQIESRDAEDLMSLDAGEKGNDDESGDTDSDIVKNQGKDDDITGQKERPFYSSDSPPCFYKRSCTEWNEHDESRYWFSS